MHNAHQNERSRHFRYKHRDYALLKSWVAEVIVEQYDKISIIIAFSNTFVQHFIKKTQIEIKTFNHCDCKSNSYLYIIKTFPTSF